MKKVVALLLIMLPLLAFSQEPLFQPRQMPNPVNFLPPYPAPGSAAFDYDQAQYLWGKEQRNNPQRKEIAVRDAVWGVSTICQEFSEPFGLQITPDGTPAIYRLLSVGLASTDQVGKIAKEHYNRTRPYVFFHEPTIVPGDEEELSHNGSYPSGHTILGWSAALLLTELNPERADTILARGYMYGESRVIAGFHWQSDVDAGRLAASAAVARLHADPRFQKLMKQARREFQKKYKGKN